MEIDDRGQLQKLDVRICVGRVTQSYFGGDPGRCRGSRWLCPHVTRHPRRARYS